MERKSSFFKNFYIFRKSKMRIFIEEGKEIKTGKKMGINVEVNRKDCFLGRANLVGENTNQYSWNFPAGLFWLNSGL